jgi:serine/threonine protein kinase
LHRDVKPSNILLDRDDFAYLIDFGIARAADETRMTKSGYAIGTFQYIAPERLGTRAEEDARADIYSLACVLYECLTGRPPFAADTMAGLVAAHLNTPPPQPSATQPNVPAQFDPVIATGMAKDPDQRYATTVELANAAHDAITTPISRPEPTPGTQPATEPAPVPTVPPTIAAEHEMAPPDNLRAQRPPGAHRRRCRPTGQNHPLSGRRRRDLHGRGGSEKQSSSRPHPSSLSSRQSWSLPWPPPETIRPAKRAKPANPPCRTRRHC